jgi:transposase
VLRRRVAELEAKVRVLAALLERHAGNSSLPPSANPPDAPKPVVKEPTGRAPGGQPGHPACRRVRLPAGRVHQVVHHVPATCQRCGQHLPAQAGPHDPEPTWHQIAELPELAAIITEHQGHARTCPSCGTRTRAAIPAEVRQSAFGPRLSGVLVYLGGVLQGSRRGVAEVINDIFGVPIALGSVCLREREAADALAPAHREALAAVRRAPVKQVDETGWKQAGKKRWLWTAATKRVSAFIIHRRRSAEGLYALLGNPIRGMIGTDRWKVYDRLNIHRRQLCWAHLLRDFKAMSERPGVAGQVGEELVCFAEDLFHDSRRIRDGTLRRSTLKHYLQCQRRWFRATLDRGLCSGCQATAAVCRDLLRLEPALWTFARRRGAEPTNNGAERALRPAVVWRKKSYGSASDIGCCYAERLLTVAATLRLRGRHVVDYLVEAITAHRHGLPAPKLLAAR